MCNLLDVCQEVTHVHENGFVHSAIKFENVLFEEVAHGRCSAKLSDFGLAYGDVVLFVCASSDFFRATQRDQTIPRHLRKDIVIMVA